MGQKTLCIQYVVPICIWVRSERCLKAETFDLAETCYPPVSLGFTYNKPGLAPEYFRGQETGRGKGRGWETQKLGPHLAHLRLWEIREGQF